MSPLSTLFYAMRLRTRAVVEVHDRKMLLRYRRGGSDPLLGLHRLLTSP